MLGRLSLFYNNYLVTAPADTRAEEKRNEMNDRKEYHVFAKGALTALTVNAIANLNLSSAAGYFAMYCFSEQISNFTYDNRNKIQQLAKSIATDVVTYVQNKAATITSPTNTPSSPRR